MEKSACSSLTWFAAFIVWASFVEKDEKGWLLHFRWIWAAQNAGCSQVPDTPRSTGNCMSDSWSSVLVNFRQISSTKVASPEIKDLISKDLLCPCCSSAKSGRRRCLCIGECETLTAFYRIVAWFTVLPCNPCFIPDYSATEPAGLWHLSLY